MKMIRKTALTLSLLTIFSAGVTTFSISGDFGQAALAASSQQKVSATGLDAKTLQLVNRGQWNDALTRLHSLIETQTAPSTDHAWLAFGDMFLDRGDDLKSILDKVQNMQGGKDSAVGKTVQMFALIREKKFDEAIKLGDELAKVWQRRRRNPAKYPKRLPIAIKRLPLRRILPGDIAPSDSFKRRRSRMVAQRKSITSRRCRCSRISRKCVTCFRTCASVEMISTARSMLRKMRSRTIRVIPTTSTDFRRS
jgi:hypothetical protein